MANSERDMVVLGGKLTAMALFYLLLGFEILVVLFVTVFLIRKIKIAIKERKNRKNQSF